MKKIVLSILVLAVVAILFSSCNKVCNCTVQYNSITLPGYDNLPVGEMSEDDCPAFTALRVSSYISSLNVRVTNSAPLCCFNSSDSLS